MQSPESSYDHALYLIADSIGMLVSDGVNIREATPTVNRRDERTALVVEARRDGADTCRRTPIRRPRAEPGWLRGTRGWLDAFET